MSRWMRVLVHHSAGPDTAGLDAEGIRRFHTAPPPAGRGWKDIGYHGLVERQGEAYVFVHGRPLDMAGSHCPGQNTIALGLCLVGNFSEIEPPEAQVAAAARAIAEWCERFGISPGEIHPHRAFRQTECPGKVPVFEIRERVAHLLRTEL